MIAKESAALRQAFKEQDGTYRHRSEGHSSVQQGLVPQQRRGGQGLGWAARTGSVAAYAAFIFFLHGNGMHANHSVSFAALAWPASTHLPALPA